MIYIGFSWTHLFISLFTFILDSEESAKVRLTYKALQLPFDGLGLFFWSRNNEVGAPPPKNHWFLVVTLNQPILKKYAQVKL